jgi:OPA family glycerol-3-phosphate transporter-like MFS transporter/OPA family sugar phosphate sensor protein UhpC-like MFS transporter
MNGITPRSGLAGLFAPDPPANVQLTNPTQIAAEMRSWRIRILVSTIIGYALYYFVRKNLSIAMPAIGKSLHITKADLGLFLTLHGVIYGLSKFANGFLGDRANARAFMITGLALSAIVNILFGSSSTAIAFGIFWMINGWVQGMGFPPCARVLTHWFAPGELARRMSIWNTSHSIGAGLVVILCGYLVERNWRLCFYVPAGLALLGCVYLAFTLRDTPEAVGLPGLAEKPAPQGVVATEERVPFGQFLREYVFGNPYIWILAFANFFVYTVRYAVLDWGPTLLHEAKGFEMKTTGWMVAAFEISGIVGMLISGWITDYVFGGRGARTCLFYMFMCTVAMFLFWKLPGASALGDGATAAQRHTAWLANTAVLCMAGFFIYGPQALVGITVANLATRRAAASAIGLTGLFGYLSTVLSGWGLGKLVDLRGWNAGFGALIGFGVVGTILFVLCWPSKPHGYTTTENQ